ncbi:unnamed protein product, partial [Durusdinium trenchii]
MVGAAWTSAKAAGGVTAAFRGAGSDTKADTNSQGGKATTVTNWVSKATSVSGGTAQQRRVETPRSRVIGPRETTLTQRKPLVLPAWPSLAAWTTYQPGTATAMQVERRVSTATAPIHVERRVSSASTSLASVERQVSTASAPVQESASGCKATLLSHGRSLSSSGRFSSTLAWSPRSVTSSFHLSPRVQTYLKPCSSSLQRPPVVRIDLTALAPQVSSSLPRRALQLVSPRETKVQLETLSKEEDSDEEEDSDDVK